MTEMYDGNCLIGSTEVQVRYTSNWLDLLSSQDYNCSGQSIAKIIETIRSKSSRKGNWNYAVIRMDEFPQPGLFKYDKNRAKVYQVPTGCEILSFKDGTHAYEPITQITVEGNCDTAELYVGGRLIQPSTNESMAVFDHETGGIKRVTPQDSVHWLVPVITQDPTPFGTYGTFEDGWFIGSVLSDGYLSGTYFGYTKLDEKTRNHFRAYLDERFPNARINVYEEYPSEHKLAYSIKFHTSDARIMSFIDQLDLYTDREHRNFSTKQIPNKYFLEGSEEFLWGIFSGLMDGDGTILYNVLTSGEFSFQTRFSTSGVPLRDSFLRLCYRLGLRCTMSISPPRFQKGGHYSKETYVLLPNSEDIQEHLHQIRCIGTRESEILWLWNDNQREEYRNSRDIIPLTDKERRELAVLALNKNKKSVYQALCDKATIGCARYITGQFVNEIRNPELKQRILNRSVHWFRPRLTGNTSRETVYDFEIPTTKVFAVNDGVVVYDTASSNGILSKQANQEVTDYLNSVDRFVHSNGNLMHGITDLIKLTIFNLSRDPSISI